MPAFDYRQAQEVRDAMARHNVRYLFIGKSGAILLGFPDTTHDADMFVDRSPENGLVLAVALRDLGFSLTGEQTRDLERGKNFVQLKNGPFDLDLVFAPDGIERFEDAWPRHIDVLSRVSQSVIWMTLSRVKRRRIVKGPARVSPASAPFATIG
jgi:hypothetical protein